jgi:hypothetical protein
MNSLKGFGAIAVLATIVLALSLVTRVHLVVVVVTTGMIISFTATYIAAIIRYRRDRFIASGGQSAYAWDGTAGPRPNARRRVHPALVIALVLVVLGAGGAFYGV